MRKVYGVPATFGLIPGRVTYIIDKQGIVRHIFSSQFAPQMHVAERRMIASVDLVIVGSGRSSKRMSRGP